MENINAIVVFLEGVLSLFSPCVLPIIPVYIAILSGSTEEDINKKNKPIVNTSLFILGISTTFFLLGGSINLFSDKFIKNKDLLGVVGGIIVMIMGLFYLGYIKLPSLNKTKKFNLENKEMKPLTAYLLGLTFSLGWSPCVGPMLTSAVVMASSTGSRLYGNFLILMYTLGFIVPFVIIAIFYEKIADKLDKIENHMGTIKKIGGILLLISGLYMTIGGMDRYGKTNYPVKSKEEIEKQKEEKVKEEDSEDDEEDIDDGDLQAAIDFELKDQYGKTHKLSDYKGKVVFLNFWATWCPPCRQEMPDIEALYHEMGENKEDVVVLGVAMPNLGDEKSQEGIEKFLKDNNYSYPVVFDEKGPVAYQYGVQSFPSTFIINKDGKVRGYIPGAVPKAIMKQVIEESM